MDCCRSTCNAGAVGSKAHLLQKGSVELLLHLAHADLQDGLLLGRQALLHVALQPPQQKGPQHLGVGD